jgi:hypothetical protein
MNRPPNENKLVTMHRTEVQYLQAEVSLGLSSATIGFIENTVSSHQSGKDFVVLSPALEVPRLPFTTRLKF